MSTDKIKEKPDKEAQFFMPGVKIMLHELSRCMGKDTGFEELLAIGICAVVRALEEYKSYDSFKEQVQKYSKLYLFRFMRNKNYSPDEISKARNMRVNNTRISKMIKVEKSLQEFAIKTIEMLVRNKHKPFRTQRAVYAGLVDTVIFYTGDTCCKFLTTPEAYMNSKVKDHIGIVNRPSKEVMALLMSFKIK